MKVIATVIQNYPVFFNKEASLQKLEALCAQNAREGEQIMLFPESFIPGYPRGFSFGTIIGSRSEEGRQLYQQYYEHSIDLESKDKSRLEDLAKKHDTYLIIGATEKESQTGSLYCSMIYISPTQGVLGVHRKIKPTGQERVIWQEAGGESLVSFQTKVGKLGGLICWENYMPLARMAMYRQGVEIYLAPTADARENWIATMKHIALEGRCFVLGCNQYFTKSMYPENLQSLVKLDNEDICPGGSIIVSPLGEVMAGPLWNQSGVLHAELDLHQIVAAKLDFDVIGHYARKDIFDLTVRNQPAIKHEEKDGLQET